MAAAQAATTSSRRLSERQYSAMRDYKTREAGAQATIGKFMCNTFGPKASSSKI